MSRPWIRNQRTAELLGLVLVAAGFLVLYDAWDGRGGRTPVAFRWLTPF